jgi:hypothetical protein
MSTKKTVPEQPATLVAGLAFAWAAITAPRDWSCALHDLDPGLDENVAIASLSSNQLQRAADRLCGSFIAVAAVFLYAELDFRI